jgi:hypothetical protein
VRRRRRARKSLENGSGLSRLLQRAAARRAVRLASASATTCAFPSLRRAARASATPSLRNATSEHLCRPGTIDARAHGVVTCAMRAQRRVLLRGQEGLHQELGGHVPRPAWESPRRRCWPPSPALRQKARQAPQGGRRSEQSRQRSRACARWPAQRASAFLLAQRTPCSGRPALLEEASSDKVMGNPWCDKIPAGDFTLVDGTVTSRSARGAPVQQMRPFG